MIKAIFTLVGDAMDFVEFVDPPLKTSVIWIGARKVVSALEAI